MPDDPRKLIFPTGIAVIVSHGKNEVGSGMPQDEPVKTEPSEKPDAVSTQAEGGLDSEAGAIEQQARTVEPLKEKENLLDAAPTPVPENRFAKKASASKP